VFAYDVTEVPGLGDLGLPSEPLVSSQALTARRLGARSAHYLVQGTTGGLVALLLAVSRGTPRGRVILPRYCHRALVSAIVLGGLEPVFVTTSFRDGEPCGPELEGLEACLGGPVRPVAVLDLYPSPYGLAHDLGAVAALAHARGVPLLVDGAHSGLFGLAPELPRAPLECGADAVVVSAHKTLGSLGQSSLLLLGDTELAPAEADVSAALRLVQTTSPSYLLLASLEAAVAWVASPDGVRELATGLAAAGEAAAGLDRAGLRLRPATVQGLRRDPLRLVIDAWTAGRTGIDLAAELRSSGGVQVESADWRNVLLILGLGDGPRTVRLLLAAARALPAARGGRGSPLELAGRLDSLSEELFGGAAVPVAVAAPRPGWFARTTLLPLDRALDRVAAEPLAPYPPGVPVVWPGERIGGRALEMVRGVLELGGEVHGLHGAAGAGAGGGRRWLVPVVREGESDAVHLTRGR
jgi:lysine decarboxylase/arginine decarboxylase